MPELSILYIDFSLNVGIHLARICWRMLADVGDGENEKTENGKCEIEKSEIARLRNCEIAKSEIDKSEIDKLIN